MHEFGLCDGVIEAVQRRAAGRRVARIGVRAGALLRVVDAAFRQAFQHAAEGTEAENATVDLVIVPARALCRDCAAEAESHEFIAVCPNCGGADLDLLGGEELVLEFLEYEAAQGATTQG
jgi:hydrogenase nickel incorporation protein HypA/HybF